MTELSGMLDGLGLSAIVRFLGGLNKSGRLRLSQQTSGSRPRNASGGAVGFMSTGWMITRLVRIAIPGRSAPRHAFGGQG